MTVKITRKSPRLVAGIPVDDHPHLYRDLPNKFPDGYFQLVHPDRTDGHNLVRNTTLVGHLEEAAELVKQGYRIRMSDGGRGASPALVQAGELDVRP